MPNERCIAGLSLQRNNESRAAQYGRCRLEQALGLSYEHCSTAVHAFLSKLASHR